jgi:SAM-dependent methyltransferase
VRKILKAINRTIGRFLPVGLLACSYPGVPGRIHVDDQMLRSEAPYDLAHYVNTGPLTVALVEDVLTAAGRTFADVRSCLLLPCGYGRTVRALVSRLDPGRITCCDVDRQAVRFCAHEFGARPLLSHRNVRRISLPEMYDLIFVGSLLTHLPPPDGVDLLRVLVAALPPSGLLVFTTQGESCLDHLSWYGSKFQAAEGWYRETVRRDGVAYLPYGRKWSYGITIHAESNVRQTMQATFGEAARLIVFKPRAWNDHQDTWAYERL